MRIHHVPNDVIVEIFSKLPAKSLLRFRWLCKHWFKVITDDPCFVKMHLNNIIIVHATNKPPMVMLASFRKQRPCTIEFHNLNTMDMDDEVLHPVHIKAPIPFTSSRVNSRILGSCNGLLCVGCSISGRDKIFIWNPCTKEYKRVIWGDDSVKIPNGGGIISYGFGYDCRIDDYIVIRNLYDSGCKGETLVDKYTLGTSSSKKLPNNRFLFNYSTSGLFVNGGLYWIARLTGSRLYDIIVAFDIVTEEYRQIATPACITHDDQSGYSMSLGKLEGCLCVLYITNKGNVEFWVMKHSTVEDMNKEYSWHILFTTSALPNLPIHSRTLLKPLMFCKNGKIAMVMNRRDFILYDPKDNQIMCLPKAIGGRDARGGMEVETYIESLVRVKGGTYIGATSSIATDKPKRKLKRPLRFQDEYK